MRVEQPVKEAGAGMVKPGLFGKGFVVTVACGIAGWLVSLQGGDPGNVALGAALIGGAAFLIGYGLGEGEGKGGEKAREREGEGLGKRVKERYESGNQNQDQSFTG
jgi:hypothetical protein